MGKSKSAIRRRLDGMGYRLSERDGLFAIIDHDTNGLIHASRPTGPHALVWDDVLECVTDLAG